jgi:histidine ammonia-lyase
VTFTLGLQPLTLADLTALAGSFPTVQLADDLIQKVNSCRLYLDQKLQSTSELVYGVNTGFGSLYHKRIAADELSTLQENLVLSHACGTGPEVPAEVVRLMLLLKIRSLGFGYSGVQLATLKRLLDFYNHGITPVVFEMGSLGASGDLAPLAHLSLPLMGLGQVRWNGKLYNATEINKQFGWEPLQLKPKEGLALLNGTQFMLAYAVLAVYHALHLLKCANTIGALSLDVFDGRPEPFEPAVHELRPHPGQIAAARFIRNLLQGSELIVQPKQHVQDPYSFRCIPQVHGASADAIQYVAQVVLTEANSVTDNPNIFAEANKIISAGNFHGQPLALVLDFLAIALAELGSISERRTFQLISGARGLPNYLVAHPGINSGLMIPQYTAASLVSQNKQLCTPASVDSIVSSNGQEDHVSMGANAALKVWRVMNNLYTILGIELFTAAQALEFRRPLKSSPPLEKLVHTFRQHVPFVEKDRFLHTDLITAEAFIRKWTFEQ